MIDEDLNQMLDALGITGVEDLLKGLPTQLIEPRPTVEDGLSEYDGLELTRELANKNTYQKYDAYLGGGAYEHHIPAICHALTQRGEFLTSYTPYQAEASQGTLQALFEFQTAICALTGMDVANASVYDGASACGEAALMALRSKKGKRKIALSPGLNPRYREVIETYLSGTDGEIVSQVDDETAAYFVQSPNYFGEIEEVSKQGDALLVLVANPLAYGLLPTAASQGADIAVGECQPFGIPLQFGGPYCGYFAVTQKLLRQMPGRVVGKTTDVDGREGYVLTLQAREQHIRREKATSNICTSQTLCALSSVIAILWYGKHGVPELATTNYQRANYLKQQLGSIDGIEIVTKGPTFNEFVVSFGKPVTEQFMTRGIIPGIETERGLLVAVTETKSKAQLDKFVSVAREIA